MTFLLTIFTKYFTKTTFLIIGALVILNIFSDLFDPILSIFKITYAYVITPYITQDTALFIRDFIVLFISINFVFYFTGLNVSNEEIDVKLYKQ